MRLTFKRVKQSIVFVFAMVFCSNVFADDDPGTNVRDEIINAKISNFRYNVAEDAVGFTLSLKAGNGYIPNNDVNGLWSNLDIYLDIYPEAGVLLDTENATNDAYDISPYLNNSATRGSNNPVHGLIPGTVPFGISLGRNMHGPDDITNDYQVIANYRIPLKENSVIPTSATYIYFRDRTSGLWSNPLAASSWSNHAILTPSYSGAVSSEEENYYIEECPPQAIWTGVVDSDWFKPGNWANPLENVDPLPPLGAVPGSCTKVFIPGSGFRGSNLEIVNPIAHFPILTSTGAECEEIIFFHGGQIGRIDLLQYERARVQLSWDGGGVPSAIARNHNTAPGYYYNFAKGYSAEGLTPGAWHMLTMPLQEIVSGDFAYGGSPFTFVRKFDALGMGLDFNTFDAIDIFGTQYTEVRWSAPYTNTNEGFLPGEAFAFYVYSQDDSDLLANGLPYTRNDGYNKAGAPYGLGVTLGIMQFPTYDDEITLRSHRVQEYNSETKESTFYDVSTNENSMGSLMGVSSTKDRNESGEYKLTSDLNTFVNDWGTVEIKNGELNCFIMGDEYILVGNPYMSALDFDAFCTKNYGTPSIIPGLESDGIKKEYQIWTGTTFESYANGVSAGSLTRHIPPLQGFFIKTRTSSPVSAVFNPTTMSTVVPLSERNNVKLRSASADNEQNIIRISTQHGDKSSRAVIAQWADATPGYVDDEDVTKLFSSYIEFPDVPEVYTLADGTALSINFLNDASTIIPIGIRIPESGETTLTLTGMINYVAEKIEFVDSQKDEVIDITGREDFSITFANEKSGYQSERFYLRITQSTTGLGATAVQSGIQIYRSGKAIQVVSSPNDQIKQIRVYDMQGRLLYNNTDVNTSIYQVTDRFESQRILLVQVVTEKNTHSVKLKN